MKKTLTSLLCAAMSLTVLALACGGEDPVTPPVPLPLVDGGVLWADCEPSRAATTCPEGASCRFVEHYGRSICVPACDPQAACAPSQAACCVGNEDGGAGYCVPNEVCAALDAGTEDAGSEDAGTGTDAGVIPVETDAGGSKDAGTEADGGGPKGDAGTGGTDAGTGGTDAGTGGTDAGTGGTDAGTGGTDAGTGGTDAGTVTDAGTGGTDAGTVTDAGSGGTDAGSVIDAGTDAGSVIDAGTDAGTVTDAGTDAGPTTGYTDIRIMASNLTSGNGQSYDPGNGINLMKGVKPDVVLIQEFNYKTDSATDIRSLAEQVVGTGAYYFRETGAQIPNGIISRWPIIESGEWTDPQVSNRDFAWARIDIPGPKDLWAISVHLLTANAGERNTEATSLVNRIKANIPAGDYLAIGGDFNTDTRTEACFTTFKQVVDTASPYPADKNNNGNTNAGRNKPYDHVLVDSDLRQWQQATVIQGATSSSTFANGLVLDSRVYTPISEISPATSGDSGSSMMQHMGVVKDFHVPNF